MAEVRFGRLRVVESTMTDSSIRRADGEAADVELVAGPVAILRGLIHDLASRCGRIWLRGNCTEAA